MSTGIPPSTEPIKAVSYEGEERILVAAIVEVFLCILGSIGNLMTVLAVCRNRALQFATNYFIVSLAVADLLVCTILVPMRAAQHFTFYLSNENIPPLAVAIAGFIGRVNIIASISHLAALSIDRCLALYYPMRYRFDIRYATGRVIGVIGVFWVFAILFTSLPYIPGISDNVFLIGFIVFVLFVTLIIIIAYVRIFQIADQARRRRRQVAALEDSSVVLSGTRTLPETSLNAKKGSYSLTQGQLTLRCEQTKATPEHLKYSGFGVNSSTENHPTFGRTFADNRPSICEPEKATRKERHRDHKTTKTIGIVIGAFILLVYPRIIVILYHFGANETSSSKLATFWVRILLYSNSVINPMLYAWRMREFREEFAKIIRTVLRRGTVTPNYQNNTAFVSSTSAITKETCH